MKRDYTDVTDAILSITSGETDEISLMASVTCELFHRMDGFDWVGFYRNVGQETLKIGPYQGGHGCLVIPFSRGVCGACATRNETVIVADVEAFPGHIACAASTRSEIVLPVTDTNGDLIAVLDIDSDTPDAFDADDAAALENIIRKVFSTGS